MGILDQLRVPTMPEFNLSQDDRLRLERLRLDRFRSEFDSLNGTITWLTLDHRLIITCLNAAQVDDLVVDCAELESSAWLMLGVNVIAICFAGEQIWSNLPALDLLDLTLEATNLGDVEEMVATLDKPQTEPATRQQLELINEPQPLRTLDELAAELAIITGQPKDEMRLALLNLNPTTYDYRGECLLSPSYCDAAIDQFASALKQRLRQAQPAEAPSGNTNGMNGKATTKTATTKRSTSKASGKPTRATRATAKKTPAKKANEPTT